MDRDDTISAAQRIVALARCSYDLGLDDIGALEAIWCGGDPAIDALLRVIDQLVSKRAAEMEAKMDTLESRVQATERHLFAAATRKCIQGIRTKPTLLGMLRARCASLGRGTRHE